MEKLTIEDAMKYPNTKLKLRLPDQDITGNLKAIYFSSNKLCIENSDCSASSAVGDFKLILRPLSSLTEEEKYFIQEHNFLSNNFNLVGKNIILGDLMRSCYSFATIKFIDYLRSLNIDIDGFLDNRKAVTQ